MSYTIHYAAIRPALDDVWESDAWSQAQTLAVDNFHPQSGAHRPRTHARLLYSNDGVHVMFRVQDEYVHSIQTQLHDQVCRDSCVEFFVEPKPGQGYFNIEINAGGTLLLYHILNGHVTKITAGEATLVRIRGSMPSVVSPPTTELTDWTLSYFVPFALFERYIGEIRVDEGVTWRANLYKCGNHMPHYASWASIGEILNFHQPEFFQPITFAPASEPVTAAV